MRLLSLILTLSISASADIDRKTCEEPGKISGSVTCPAVQLLEKEIFPYGSTRDCSEYFSVHGLYERLLPIFRNRILPLLAESVLPGLMKLKCPKSFTAGTHGSFNALTYCINVHTQQIIQYINARAASISYCKKLTENEMDSIASSLEKMLSDELIDEFDDLLIKGIKKQLKQF